MGEREKKESDMKNGLRKGEREWENGRLSRETKGRMEIRRGITNNKSGKLSNRKVWYSVVSFHIPVS